MNYAIIAENDLSNWNDLTGDRYHFPNKYSKILEAGTKVIYYKGKLTNKSFSEQRLSPEPHYFGIAKIGYVYPDPKSAKNKYAKIENYVHFSKPIIAKKESGYFEEIPDNKTKNYWRDGVRIIDENVYKAIIEPLGINDEYRDFDMVEDSYASYKTEGKKGYRYSSYYERIAANREAALSIHGYTCKACNFNFTDIYGDLGKDFIHVHHIKPISQSGETVIDPKTDLIPLCPNCHSMIHRDKERTLGIEDLKQILKETAELRNAILI
jgi:5-methylcytosine-specific restriction enzyme A